MLSATAVFAGRVLAELIVATVVLLGTLLLLWLVRGPWWPSTIFQLAHRRSIYAPRLFWSFVMILAIAGGIGSSQGAAAAILVWLVLAPRLVSWWSKRAAWKADLADPELQQEARAIRARLRARADGTPPAAGRPWSEYVFDIERAKRARLYRPPGE